MNLFLRLNKLHDLILGKSDFENIFTKIEIDDDCASLNKKYKKQH